MTTNRNTNLTSEIVLRDGTSQIVTYRNSFGGYLNALDRAGIDPRDVVEAREVLTDADRV